MLHLVPSLRNIILAISPKSPMPVSFHCYPQSKTISPVNSHPKKSALNTTEKVIEFNISIIFDLCIVHHMNTKNNTVSSNSPLSHIVHLVKENQIPHHWNTTNSHVVTLQINFFFSTFIQHIKFSYSWNELCKEKR